MPIVVTRFPPPEITPRNVFQSSLVSASPVSRPAYYLLSRPPPPPTDLILPPPTDPPPLPLDLPLSLIPLLLRFLPSAKESHYPLPSSSSSSSWSAAFSPHSIWEEEKRLLDGIRRREASAEGLSGLSVTRSKIMI